MAKSFIKKRISCFLVALEVGWQDQVSNYKSTNDVPEYDLYKGKTPEIGQCRRGNDRQYAGLGGYNGERYGPPGNGALCGKIFGWIRRAPADANPYDDTQQEIPDDRNDIKKMQSH